MFIRKLKNINEDLEKHKRDKSKLLQYYIQKRLNKSFKEYYKTISHDVEYMERVNDLKVMRKLNRM